MNERTQRTSLEASANHPYLNMRNIPPASCLPPIWMYPSNPKQLHTRLLTLAERSLELNVYSEFRLRVVVGPPLLAAFSSDEGLLSRLL